MLFSGLGSVRKVKNCDRGLEKPEVTVFHLRTDPKPENFFFFPAVNWLTSRFVYATLSLNWLTCRVQTIAKKLTSERASNSDTRQIKMYSGTN